MAWSIASDMLAHMAAARRKWELYPRSHSTRLDRGLFRLPTSEYRGTPFWSWNTRLNFSQLSRQIDHLQKMGFGGVHIHARTGLATEYLGRDFMSLVKQCHARLKRRGMLTWLYDEDRWPSGFAGGLVSSDVRFREKTLFWTQNQDASTGELLGRYIVTLREGRLVAFERLAIRDLPPKGTWYAYLHTAKPESWFNHQTYIDTFNPAAVARFIEITHERYRACLGSSFGTTVPAIFTDEPHFTKKQTLAVASAPQGVVLPFSDLFCATFEKRFRHDLLDSLPELFWDRADARPSLTRYQYHEHTAELFASSFGDTIARWCARNRLALTGHMLSEATLFGQTRAVGEAMRGLRSFQLPGIDMLEDKIELTTAKQAQSVARQNGRPGVVSELYGVTNWDFDFAGHKRQGDWQAALGVTVRVPHLAWVSMAGESKRDYPAAIGYQSPWYREYKVIEDHFARVAVAMTRGRPVVRVAVIHPIESFWLHWGPADDNCDEWARREAEFKDLTHWLTFGGIDFDFVSESSLAPRGGVHRRGAGKDGLRVGKMAYDAVIVPGCQTIRTATLNRLKQFQRLGGTIIFAGTIPSLVDARPSAEPAAIAAKCRRVSFDESSILAAVAPFRELRIALADGAPTDSIAHQLRHDGTARYLFLCNTRRREDVGDVAITVNGRWQVEEFNTFTGMISSMTAAISGEQTVIPWRCLAHGHLLLRLTPRTRQSNDQLAKTAAVTRAEPNLFARPLPARTRVILSEPNVLLLDQAEWKLDGERKWRQKEEILRLDNLVRQHVGLPSRGGRNAQPWVDTAPDPVKGLLHLRFAIDCKVAVTAPQLAMENPADATLTLNGRRVATKPVGWWVDEAIRTVSLPSLKPGAHTLEICIPMRRRTNVEWCYLLGSFGVRVKGRRATIIEAPKTLKFGDWTHQGLPFYAGNVTYEIPIRGQGRAMRLRAARFSNPLLTVAIDEKRLGPVAFAPHEIELGKLKGTHMLSLTAFGNRHNAFGPLHHTKRDLTWVGPAAWRSSGEWWSYDYHFKPIGILEPPLLLEAA